eukprot:TRINITY_DN35072_c0_g1_i1.p1 TRINITY_DN35072_c0_g1~~TRINITY_DN35072_c0_g1_i1.p1  ORF type:complete len:163 (+),score=20.80 TRINITY_DN35072_c0_g1_i1:72-560(+)
MFRLLFPASAALAAASTMAHRGAVTSTQTRTETIVEGREFAAVRKLLSGADAAALYPRKWQEVSSSACLQQSAKFRIAQFNILADGLSGKSKRLGGFTECDPGALQWEYRKHRILEELFRHGRPPDIIALQEVDHFHDWFQPFLAELGYDGQRSLSCGGKAS